MTIKFDKVTGEYRENNTYTMQCSCNTANTSPDVPQNGTTYYFGSFFGEGMSVYYDLSRMYVPRSGVIKKVYFIFAQNSGFSAETATINLYKNNNFGTPYLISNSIVHNNYQTFASNTNLNIPVTAGEWFVFGYNAPLWTTHPTGMMYINAMIEIEY